MWCVAIIIHVITRRYMIYDYIHITWRREIVTKIWDCRQVKSLKKWKGSYYIHIVVLRVCMLQIGSSFFVIDPKPTIRVIWVWRDCCSDFSSRSVVRSYTENLLALGHNSNCLDNCSQHGSLALQSILILNDKTFSPPSDTMLPLLGRFRSRSCRKGSRMRCADINNNKHADFQRACRYHIASRNVV